MLAGLAGTEITPPPNVPMDGFEARRGGSQGAHDPLFAHAFVCESAGTTIGWILADLVGIPAAVTAAVRARAGAALGLPEDHVMVSATHTHGGPGVRPMPDLDADHGAHARWLADLPVRLADTLMRAAAGLEPVELLRGRAACATVQHNRRFHMKDGTLKMVWDDPDPAEVARLGPVDPAVEVLAIRAAGRLRGVLLHFACHPTVLIGDNVLITADWPGVVRSALRETHGPDLWVATAQGCCGDITPSPPRGSYAICEAKGRAIARCVREALERASPVSREGVAAARERVRLPRPGMPDYRGEVQGLRLGETAIVGLPGEPVIGIGLAIKARSAFPVTLVGGYTNDYDDAELGYIPQASDYPDGGYEVGASRVAPGADALLTAAAASVLRGLDASGDR